MSRTLEPCRELYPQHEPYDTGYLQVSPLHSLYYEQSGNRRGIPALLVHGGPGSGTSPQDRGFFDPDVYRIVLLDQRGSGKSTPGGELKENTTWHSVSDIEALREHLSIEAWGVLLGGSWGSTLILAYAQTHPTRLKAMVMRGIYLARRKEVDWLYNGYGLNEMIPDFWETFVELIPSGERRCVLDAYYRRLSSDDPEVVKEAAHRWCQYEMASSFLQPPKEKINIAQHDADYAYKFARLECHYAVHCCFLKWDSQLLDGVDKIRHIPCTIVQGRYDLNCAPGTAWELHKKWPEAEMTFAPTDGHNSMEPGIRTRLLDASDKYKHLLTTRE